MSSHVSLAETAGEIGFLTRQPHYSVSMIPPYRRWNFRWMSGNEDLEYVRQRHAFARKIPVRTECRGST